MNNMTKYIDNLGRWHIKPVTESKPYPTNNAYIYSFYAKMVGLPVVISHPAVSQLMNLDTTVLTRHPGDNTPPISHDEYVGAAGLDPIYATDIVEYGEKNYWQFCDVIVDGKAYVPTPWRKLVIDDVMAAYEELANDKDDLRKASAKYPALYPFAFWHRPEQQYFYYRCAGQSPSIIRSIYFFIATLVSIYSKNKKSPMLGFKMLKFKKLGPNLMEKALIKLFDKYGNWKEVCKNYFPEDHPILEKVLSL